MNIAHPDLSKLSWIMISVPPNSLLEKICKKSMNRLSVDSIVNPFLLEVLKLPVKGKL